LNATKMKLFIHTMEKISGRWQTNPYRLSSYIN
jgi:hypothetical protein